VALVTAIGGSGLVNRFTGLVEYVHPMSFTPDSIADTLYSGKSADIGGRTGAASDAFSMGPGETAEGARRACIGEAVERFSLSGPRTFLHQRVGHDDFQVPPAAFQRFAPEQYEEPGFPFPTVRNGDSIAWLPARELGTTRAVLVPAQMAVFVDAHALGEQHYESATSSGVAAGPTFAFAAKRAVLELIERDAFQRTWLRGESPPALDWRASSHLSDPVRRQLGRLERLCDGRDAALSLRVLPSVFGVPVLLAVVRSPLIGIAVGCAADIDVDRAALNAGREALHTCNWALRLLGTEPLEAREVYDFEDHIRFHCRPSARPTSAFLSSSAARVTELDAARNWPEITDRILAAGASVLVADVTSPEAAAAGLHVVRALSPDLVALDVRYDARFLGHPRLYGGGIDGPGHLTRDPHPFP
jgi:ribosomal protein S12 methylthiotransferase accessory factor